MAKEKKVFNVVIEGQEQEFGILKPTQSMHTQAQMQYNKTFAELLRSDVLVRPELDSHMRKKGLWNDEKQEEYEKVTTQLRDYELKLKMGGMKLSEGKQLALQMRDLRDQLRELNSERTVLDAHTAEGQAENARFNYLVSQCLVYNDSEKPVYQNVQDYLDASDEVSLEGARQFAAVYYGYDTNFVANLPENKFLRQYRFVDDQLRFIDKDGHLIDEEGRLINEKGNYVDKDGNLVDRYGRRVDENGDFICETLPFLDEDGNPITE